MAKRTQRTCRCDSCAKIATMNLVRNHSHWGAFFAEVEGGRVVGVQPFEKDPDPSHLINAIPESVHSKSRIAQPMVREGWLKSATSRDTGPPPRKPVATFAEIMAELERDREDR